MKVIRSGQLYKATKKDAIVLLSEEEFLEKLENLLQPLKEVLPGLDKYSWRQYTPIFNDGSPCTFTVQVSDSFDLQYDDHLYSYLEAVKELELLDSPNLKKIYDDLAAFLRTHEHTLELRLGTNLECVVNLWDMTLTVSPYNEEY